MVGSTKMTLSKEMKVKVKENLSETSEANLARPETSVLGNVHRDIQTDFSFSI